MLYQNNFLRMVDIDDYYIFLQIQPADPNTSFFYGTQYSYDQLLALKSLFRLCLQYYINLFLFNNIDI